MTDKRLARDGKSFSITNFAKRSQTPVTTAELNEYEFSDSEGDQMLVSIAEAETSTNNADNQDDTLTKVKFEDYNGSILDIGAIKKPILVESNR